VRQKFRGLHTVVDPDTAAWSFWKVIEDEVFCKLSYDEIYYYLEENMVKSCFLLRQNILGLQVSLQCISLAHFTCNVYLTVDIIPISWLNNGAFYE
jgi:hypothetical protein